MYAFLIYIINSQRDYKDSELYINWIAGADKTHDVFYADPMIIASYRSSFPIALSLHSWPVHFFGPECYVNTIVKDTKYEMYVL